MGFLIAGFLIIGIAYLPLYMFKENTLLGTYIRANAPLISLLAGERFMASLHYGKKGSSIMVVAFIIYGLLALTELIRRRGMPIIEWGIMIAAFIFFYPTQESRYLFFLIVSVITFTFAYSQVWKEKNETAQQ